MKLMFLAALAAAALQAQAPNAPVSFINEIKQNYTGIKNNLLRADRKSTRLNSSHSQQSRMPSSA